MERECHISVVDVCGICALEHVTENCATIPGLQAIYKGVMDTNDPSQEKK